MRVIMYMKYGGELTLLYNIDQRYTAKRYTYYNVSPYQRKQVERFIKQKRYGEVFNYLRSKSIKGDLL